jgi:hypothetical protein
MEMNPRGLDGGEWSSSFQAMQGYLDNVILVLLIILEQEQQKMVSRTNITQTTRQHLHIYRLVIHMATMRNYTSMDLDSISTDLILENSYQKQDKHANIICVHA